MLKKLFALILIAAVPVHAANDIVIQGGGTGSIVLQGGAGSGSNILPLNNVWTGIQTYQNSSTSPTLLLQPTGNVPTTPGTGGAIVVDMTNSTGNGIQVYTNRGHGTQLTGLMSLYSNTTSYDEPMIYIKSLSDSTIGANADIRIDATNPDIELIETDQVSPAGKFEIAVQADVLQFNSRNAADNSFQAHLSMNHAGALRFKEGDNGGDFVAFIATQTLAFSTTWVLPAQDGTANQALVTDGAGNLSFKTPAGAGDAILAANQTWTGVNTYNVTAAGGAIKVNQSGTTTDSPQTGAIAVNNTGNNNIGLAVYTNTGASQNDPLVLFQNDNTAFNAYFFELVSKATGFPSTTIEMQAPIPSVEFRGNTTSPPVNEYQISEKVDQLRLEGRLADNSGFDSIMVLQRPTSATNSAGLVGIGNNYNFPLNSLDVGGDTSGSTSPGTALGNMVVGRSYAFTVTAPADSLLVQGHVGVGSLTLAQINATTPVKIGQLIYCSDCATFAVCVSSGTGTGAFVSPVARTTHCN